MNQPSSKFGSLIHAQPGGAVRWRRWCRRALNALALVAIVIFAGLVLFPRLQHPPRAGAAEAGAALALDDAIRAGDAVSTRDAAGAL